MTRLADFLGHTIDFFCGLRGRDLRGLIRTGNTRGYTVLTESVNAFGPSLSHCTCHQEY